jgi:hypothetical protein
MKSEANKRTVLIKGGGVEGGRGCHTYEPR